MFFLAGLLVAGLAGLLILPAFARRALRLAAARARLLAPLSMKDVVAERDLLRAEHAVEQHRIERQLAAVQDATARHRADLGRQAACIVAFEGETARLTGEIAGLRKEVAGRERDILTLEGDLGASQIGLHDFSVRLDRAASEIASLDDKRVTLETLADDQRAEIAGLETRVAGLEMKLGDAAQLAKNKAVAAEADKARLSAELASRADAVARLSAELGAASAKTAATAAELERKNGELERTRQRVAELEGARTPEGDLALRQAIAQLAADVVRLSAASADGQASNSNAGRAVWRDPQAPSSQGPDKTETAAPVKLRELQSMIPGR